MSWIESHQSLRFHPKTLAACALLNMERHKFIGHLHCLWWWALDVADVDGHLPKSCTVEVIAEAAELPRRHGVRFVDALVSAGFLEKHHGGWALHDWYDYAGKLNARRVHNRDAMRAARGKVVEDTDESRVDHVSPQNKPRVDLPTHSTNQPTNPTNSTRQNGHSPAKSHPLNFKDEDWSKLHTQFPGADLFALWKEWVSWNESRGERLSNPYGAFVKFVKQKSSAAAAAP